MLTVCDSFTLYMQMYKAENITEIGSPVVVHTLHNDLLNLEKVRTSIYTIQYVGPRVKTV